MWISKIVLIVLFSQIFNTPLRPPSGMDGLTFWDGQSLPFFWPRNFPWLFLNLQRHRSGVKKWCGCRSLQQWSVRSSKNDDLQFHLLNIPTLMAITIGTQYPVEFLWGFNLLRQTGRSRPCAPNPSGLGYPPVAPHGHCAQCHDAPAIGHVLRQLPGFCSSHNCWKWRLKLHILVGRCDALTLP